MCVRANLNYPILHKLVAMCVREFANFFARLTGFVFLIFATITTTTEESRTHYYIHPSIAAPPPCLAAIPIQLFAI